MKRLILLALIMIVPALGERAAAISPALPDDSLYLFDASFTDQAGRAFRLADRRGRPQLVAMFYTSCRFVCPLIIDSAKSIENALTPAERGQLGILLITMDPVRDDAAALNRVFKRRKLDPAVWTLARTDGQNVRSVAALLGVRYRALADGEFNHTSALVLLDGNGRRVASTAVLGTRPDPGFIATLHKTLSGE